MNKIAKKYYLILFFIVIIANFVTTTYAVELNNESSLQISFITENNTLPMKNVDISIYKLASFENYIAKWQDIYSKYIIDLGTSSDEKIISRATQLADFVKLNNINADYKITTDDNGKNEVTFENGIYLICGSETIKNEVTYTPTPCIIQLPYTNEHGTLIYNASIELKYNRKENEIIPEPEPSTPEQNTLQNTIQPEKSENSLPRTGDVIQIVVGILILVIVLNIIQIINERKHKNDE